MPMVPPGCETGLYYIILAGLHWEATWQNVRDELRAMTDPCEVDYVEVFKGTGNGWVRIVGEDDAVRAHEYLNGHYMMGVHLISFFRNRYDPVMLRDPSIEGSDIQATRHHPRHRHLSAREPPLPLPPMEDVQQRTVLYSMYNDSQQSPSQPRGELGSLSSQYSVRPCFTAQPVYNVIYTQSPVNSGQFAYVSDPQQLIILPPALQPRGPLISHELLTQTTAKLSLSEMPEPPDFTNIAARKIAIKNLPKNIKSGAINRILQDIVAPNGSPPNAILTLDIPLHSNGRRRGHAVALLATERMASRACEALDGKTLEGKKLRVCLTERGGSEIGSTGHEGAGEGQSLGGREKESPLVVNGSIKYDKSRGSHQSSKGKEREKKSR